MTTEEKIEANKKKLYEVQRTTEFLDTCLVVAEAHPEDKELQKDANDRRKERLKMFEAIGLSWSVYTERMSYGEPMQFMQLDHDKLDLHVKFPVQAHWID